MPRSARAASPRHASLATVASMATVVVALASGGPASAQQPTPTPTQPTLAPPKDAYVRPAAASPDRPATPAGQGIAVLAIGPARDEAFALARAVYGSRLRPTSLDEVRARVLAGAAPPPNASRELRELAEVRAGITTEDAAARRLLTGIAQQVGAQALLVVKVERAPAAAPPATTPPATEDAGAAAATPGADAAADAGAGNAAPATTVVARLFLTDSGDFDAARYAPDPGPSGAAAWRSTVTSLEARFPPASRVVGPNAATSATPVKIKPEDEKSSPFYASGWFWGAVAGAAVLGGAFYFATRDTGSDPIHVQLKVPR